MTERLSIVLAACTCLHGIAKMVQVSCSHKAISAIVAWAGNDQDTRVGLLGVLRGQRCGTGQPCQLHELVHAEAQRPHQLLVHLLGL